MAHPRERRNLAQGLAGGGYIYYHICYIHTGFHSVVHHLISDAHSCDKTVLSIFIGSGYTLGTRDAAQTEQTESLSSWSFCFMKEIDNKYVITWYQMVHKPVRCSSLLNLVLPLSLGLTFSSRLPGKWLVPHVDSHAWLSLTVDICRLTLMLCNHFPLQKLLAAHQSLNLLCCDQWMCAFPTWMLIF